MSLDELRRRIDAIDAELRRVLNERAAVAQAIGRIKGEGPSYRPEREADVLRRAIADNPGPLDDDELARIMREVMSACLRLERPLRVAYLGPVGSHSQAAVAAYFGGGVEAVGVATIPDAFAEVERGRCDQAIVPIENVSQGMVGPTLDALLATSLRIGGEITVPIHHHLLGNDPTVIRAHPQAFLQCRRWLDANHPDARRIETSSTSEAARLCAAEGGAAIASEAAAAQYELPMLASRIEDDPRNRTRFIVVGNRDVPATGDDKTSIVFAARNAPGALRALLEPFATAGIDIQRIQTRPTGGDWQDHFFVDLAGHAEEPAVADALALVANDAAYYKQLGSYPTAVV